VAFGRQSLTKLGIFSWPRLYFAAFLTQSQTKKRRSLRSNVSMDNFKDAVLKKMYLEYNTPCDRLVSNPIHLEEFTQDYVERTGHNVDPSLLAHHLLNLRRRGKANGGLDRLRRKYNGRN
jgi:hypothetical protein